MIDYRRLSKTIAVALRHKPWVYELELDEAGWVDVEALLEALRHEQAEWAHLTIDDVQAMLASADKQRYELSHGRIRALYGHSAVNSIHHMPAVPPPVLLHGTPAHLVDIILHEGLKPIKRQYVHFSIDEAMARSVGRRKSSKVVILKIDAQRAYQAGTIFYQGNAMVWLAEAIAPEYIEVAYNE